MGKKKKVIVKVVVALVLAITVEAEAMCPSGFLNPIDDIAWEGIFPIKIGGVVVSSSDFPDSPDAASAAVCICPDPMMVMRPGITTAFWEPIRMIETVKEPFCFPTVGLGLPNPVPGTLTGSSEMATMGNTGESTTLQAHYFIYPVWGLMGMMTDSMCVESSTGLDVAYITEVDPLWQNDLLAFFLNPEALLFANPVASIACIADSVASNAGLSIPFLFWCMGSWGNAYPLSGHVMASDPIQSGAAIAGRMVYKMGRMGLAYDAASNVCFPIPAPIWNKSYYRLNLSRPRKSGLTVIGRSDLIWGWGKNLSVLSGDNNVWTLWRKRACCAF
ncbi:MAG: TraU family protein [Nitrospinota bacterium]|nr:TraU family protein [Nitrospinota bacterium]